MEIECKKLFDFENEKPPTPVSQMLKNIERNGKYEKRAANLFKLFILSVWFVNCNIMFFFFSTIFGPKACDDLG